MIRLRAILWFTQFAGKCRFLHPFQTAGLRFAATFRQRFGNVCEQDGNPQPEAYRASKPGITWHLPGCHRRRDKGRQQTADPDNKHDRIAPLGMWA